MLTDSYQIFYDRLVGVIPETRLIHDEFRRFALGADASFYRLIPKIIVKVESETEVIKVLYEARTLRLPLTFRAAGTSLSGQAISDSILVMLGSAWTTYDIGPGGSTICLQAGVIGGDANSVLAPYERKIGPDPASLNSAMIGGIAANNASGMCCGTAQNSYQTIDSIRIVLVDGTILDTGDEQSRRLFRQSHSSLMKRITDLAIQTKQNESLAGRIRDKFKMKNTTGYSLNALVDFTDPIDIIEHLMIGSEGTLAFIAEVTYNTVPEYKFKATSLMLFPDIQTASTAVTIMKQCRVDAVELMDRASLRSVERKDGMPGILATLPPDAAALLVETRAVDDTTLQSNILSIIHAVEQLPSVRPAEFTTDTSECAQLWNIRKGLFPSVGAMRKTGTTVIIEDVTFPVSRLALATLDLQHLFAKHRYDDAIIFGHALEGNLHFVFKQDFNAEAEVNRYGRFMDELATLVVKKYDGALKAEHGTGRNMAPFVEFEWGSEAFGLMKEIKAIFDPDNMLNPNVIFTAEPGSHLKNLKPLPTADPLIDKCIECGFCEARCPSRTLTLTPRQRIVAYREMSRLTSTRENPQRLAMLHDAFKYFAEETCATDGLCATSCPVNIDTGKLIKQLRVDKQGPLANGIASLLSRNMTFTCAVVRFGLNALNAVHRIIGTETMSRLATSVRRCSGNRIPQWNPVLPEGADPLPPSVSSSLSVRPKVVYIPSCISRTMGVAGDYDDTDSLTTKTIKLLTKAGFEIVYPENVSNLCCGLAFSSKGFKKQGDWKAKELETALLKASAEGTLPILSDTSPCLLHMRETLDGRLNVLDLVEFMLTYVVGRLKFQRREKTIALHTACSSTKMGLEAKFKQLAGLCAENVVVPFGVGCCGWAGDRGFSHPELNAAALGNLRKGIPTDCTQGYSTSRMCEIGLSLQSGINYKSIIYLLDKCSVSCD